VYLFQPIHLAPISCTSDLALANYCARLQIIFTSLLYVCVGVGYHMVMTKKSTCDTATVTRVVQSHVAGARLSSDVTAELCYILPQESKASFSQLFIELDKNKDTLGITSYGASVTTMDEVFIRLLLDWSYVVVTFLMVNLSEFQNSIET